jgi:hypothetical protein
VRAPALVWMYLESACPSGKVKPPVVQSANDDQENAGLSMVPGLRTPNSRLAVRETGGSRERGWRYPALDGQVGNGLGPRSNRACRIHFETGQDVNIAW